MPMNVSGQPPMPGMPQNGMMPRPPQDYMEMLRAAAAQMGIPVELLIEELKRRKRAQDEAMGRQPGSFSAGGSENLGGPGFNDRFNDILGGGISGLVSSAMAGMRR